MLAARAASQRRSLPWAVGEWVIFMGRLIGCGRGGGLAIGLGEAGEVGIRQQPIEADIGLFMDGHAFGGGQAVVLHDAGEAGAAGFEVDIQPPEAWVPFDLIQYAALDHDADAVHLPAGVGTDDGGITQGVADAGGLPGGGQWAE